MEVRRITAEPKDDNGAPQGGLVAHPTSFCDSDGQLFCSNGRLLRGIRAEYVDLCLHLFDTGEVDRLVERGYLIDSAISDEAIPGFPLVLTHRRLPFVSYGNEWSPGMLLAAGRHLVDMLDFLYVRGLTVDVGTWDVLFDGPQPVFVDFCSIARADPRAADTWKMLEDEFVTYFSLPLLLMASGKANLARWVLADYEHRAIHREFADLHGYKHAFLRIDELARSASDRLVPNWLPDGLRRPVHRVVTKIASVGMHRRREPKKVLARLRTSIDARANELQRSRQRGLDPGRSRFGEGDPPSAALQAVLEDLGPLTVMDMGCGDGRFSFQAATYGADVVAVDKDDAKIDDLFEEATRSGLRILPLVMDLRAPSAGYGLGAGILEPAHERLACELVLAMRLADRMLLDQPSTLERFVRTLFEFSSRWALVGFEEAPLDYEGKPRSELPPTYSLESMVAALSDRFATCELLPYDGGTMRYVLCHR